MAARYFVGSGNWNDTNRWSTTSGGSGGASVPAVGVGMEDDVYFDSNSGNATVNVTVGTTVTGLLSINFTGYTSTITMSNNIHIAAGGTVSIDSTNVTTSGTSPLYLNSTVTLNSGGGSWGGNVTFGAGAKTLTSDFRILGSTSTVSGGNPSISGASFKYYSNGLTIVPALLGNSTFVLTGGTWSGAGQVLTNLHFDGNVIVSGSVIWSPTVANGAATLKYVSGTINTGTSTLTTALTGTSGITIFDAGGIDFYNLTLTGPSGSTRMTINSQLSVTNTISLASSINPLTIDGSSNFNSSGTLLLGFSITINLTTEMIVGALSKAANYILTINGSSIRFNGNLPVGTVAILGTGGVKLGGGGTWTAGNNAGIIRTNLEFVGDYTVSGNVYWSPTVANGAATLKYTSGTITTTGSTLNTTLITTASIINFDTSNMMWNNITFPGVLGTVVPVLVSDLRCSGTLTNGATGNFTPSGTGAIRAGAYTGIAGSVVTLNTDWYISSLTFNSLLFNTNKVFIDTLLTPFNTTSVLGAGSGSTTEFVMTSGSIIGLGGSSGWNVPVTIAPTTGNTVTASGSIRIGNNVARTLKFDTTSGGTFNAGASAISFGITNSTLTIDLSGAGIINLDSCTISNSGAGLTISVTTGSASFNSGTSTLNISTGGTTLNTQGISWFNITTAAHTHTLNSSLVSIGTFQMNGASTFTNGNLYWDPQGTLSLGTGAVGFTFSLPKTVTVQNLVLNSAGGGSAMLLNNNSINVTGNLTMTASSTGAGTTQINLIGTGTWSNTGGISLAWIRNPVTINTAGTITLGATVIVYNTTTYTAGIIDSVTNSSTLFVYETTLVGFGSTSTSYLNNLTVLGSLSGTALTINSSQAYFLGTVTSSGNTSFTVGSSSTFGFSTNILSFQVNATHTFKALTEYIVRGQLILRGLAGASTVLLRSSVANTSNRFKLTLVYGATQRVSFVNAQYIDSSEGQTIWNYKPNSLTSTINWGTLVTPVTIGQTWVS